MWTFLWNNKHPLVNKKTKYFNSDEGGVNLLNLREFIESIHTHFVYKILKSEHENWNIIGKTWLKSYDTEYNIEYFVCKCPSVKGLCLQRMPNYYQGCILSWVKLECIFMQKNKRKYFEFIFIWKTSQFTNFYQFF